MPDAPKQFASKLNILAQANCASERQHLVRNRTTSTGLSRGRKHPKTILLLHSLHSVPRSLNEESRCLMLAPKGAGLRWLAWERRPFLRSQMDQGEKALALVHQKPISQVCSCGTLAARFRQVRHKTQACRRNEPETSTTPVQNPQFCAFYFFARTRDNGL